MPIQLNTPTPMGVSATYHALANITFYPMQQQVTVVVQSYATSDTTMQQMLSRPYSFDYSALNIGADGPPEDDVYAYLLTLPDYAGGTII